MGIRYAGSCNAQAVALLRKHLVAFVQAKQALPEPGSGVCLCGGGGRRAGGRAGALGPAHLRVGGGGMQHGHGPAPGLHARRKSANAHSTGLGCSLLQS